MLSATVRTGRLTAHRGAQLIGAHLERVPELEGPLVGQIRTAVESLLGE